MRTFSLRTLAAVAPFAIALGCAAMPHEARADGPVSPKGKGIVGGAFLGAEIVTMPMGIAGLKPRWPYVVFGTVGAAGGADGGSAIESQIIKTPAAGQQAGPPAEATVGMLAAGLALVIPTLVVSLNATTRHSRCPTSRRRRRRPKSRTRRPMGNRQGRPIKRR